MDDTLAMAPSREELSTAVVHKGSTLLQEDGASFLDHCRADSHVVVKDWAYVVQRESTQERLH